VWKDFISDAEIYSDGYFANGSRTLSVLQLKGGVMQTSFEGGEVKKVWIDLDNSPHVPFFQPIIKKFKGNGYTVVLTARDCFQTCGLADYHKLKYIRVGKHYGKNKVLKVIGTLLRVLQLLPIAIRMKPAMALSHGSRAMVLAANILNIPSVVLMDYEFTKGIPFSIARPVLSINPEVVLVNATFKKNRRVASYPGIKEDVYVPFFKPDSSIKGELKLDDNQIVVTIRPPATEAHYHNPESEGLFTEVLNSLGAVDNVKMIILPRNEVKQTVWIKQKWPEFIRSEKVVIPKHVVDGLNLIWHSDFVVSGGGTMNREAAALGVPVYSIFRGQIGAVDRYLEADGRLTLLKSIADVRSKIDIRKRNKKPHIQKVESPALDSIMATLYKFINE
jgi:predicted glycosyltransferase